MLDCRVIIYRIGGGRIIYKLHCSARMAGVAGKRIWVTLCETSF